MTLFSRKSKKEAQESSEISKLPELPLLPSLKEFYEEKNKGDKLPQLPTFPNNSFGEKFSRSTIKEAISGEEEDEKEEADEFEIPNFGTKMMPKPLENKQFTIEPEKQRPPAFEEYKQKETEPIFVRIDKFKEARHIFEETKKQFEELNKFLEDTKKIKEKEDETVAIWEREIQKIKSQIERVDKEIFSKV
jgi:hypothetical protein